VRARIAVQVILRALLADGALGHHVARVHLLQQDVLDVVTLLDVGTDQEDGGESAVAKVEHVRARHASLEQLLALFDGEIAHEPVLVAQI
jgi:hypothetical protein